LLLREAPATATVDDLASGEQGGATTASPA
jgi:hypothetical protein